MSWWSACCLCGWLLLSSGCGTGGDLAKVQDCTPAPPLLRDGLAVSSQYSWTEAGVEVVAGDVLTIHAEGVVQFRDASHWDRDRVIECGPEGTYFWEDDVTEERFPLSAGASGPAPCYGLIGRIGEGTPFFIGRNKSWPVRESGRLYLGINDFDLSDNTGSFSVHIEKSAAVQPLRLEESIGPEALSGGPLPGSSVVVFYIDGLRPDVVQEMAAMGHLPHIRSLFLEGGTWVKQATTVFPSDTITSNGTMWTGCFSDRHGLKGQVRFSRRSLHSESYLESLGPSRSSQLLAAQGIDKAIQESKIERVRLHDGDLEAERKRQRLTSNASPIYKRLQDNGQDWATGILPVMTEVPPLLWTRSMVRYVPYLQAQKAWQYVDDANTHFALKHLLPRQQPVTIIWLPETDSVSHKLNRGQFGMTRRTIARADVLIGQVVEELAAQGRLQSTYLMLVSDHGHHGGQYSHLTHFDLAHHVFFDSRKINSQGEWIGGGLGMSVRQHRSWSRHPEDDSKSFVFLDANSDGAARIFLPRGHFRSGEWVGYAAPGNLFCYQIAPHQPPVNLVETILQSRAGHTTGTMQHPVDLVMLKLREDAMLISTLNRGRAVIERQRTPENRWVYRYTVVTHLQPTPDGQIAYDEVVNPQTDPLGVTRILSPEQLAGFHDERFWLQVMSHSEYPDGVITLSRHMFWDRDLQLREEEYAPDLVVTARRGWFFGTQSSPGTMHGYPFVDSMRSSWFIAGPNIRRGAVLEQPARTIDLAPTILDMVGCAPSPCEVDGQPLRSIYCAPVSGPVRPLVWDEVDLQGWNPLGYCPLPEYAHLPRSINRPEKFLDLHNVSYGLLAVTDVSYTRIFDQILDPLEAGDGWFIHWAENRQTCSRRSEAAWLSEGSVVMDVTGFSLSDKTITSLGNMQRLSGGVDWLQNRSLTWNHFMAGLWGREYLPGTGIVGAAIDTTQEGFWEFYRFGQRVLVQVADEAVLNNVEDGTDKAINHFHRVPAEVRVP